jgi:hypothetical protein
MIKLYDRLIELYKNDKSQLSSILGLFYNIDIDFQIINKSKNKKLIFRYQDGGKIKSYNFENNNYYYNVEYAKSKDNSSNEVHLITINDGTVGCAKCTFGGLILIDNKTHYANIQSVADYSDCIKCDNPNIKYKVGAIMIQIMIEECKKLNVKKITLEDNSKKYFSGSSIELIYYRTMAQGTPYYSKFGFKHITPLKVRNNHDKWLTNPTITKNKIIKLFNNNIEDNEENSKIIKLFNKIVDKYTDNIIVSNFVINLFDKAVTKEKDISEKRNLKLVNKKINLYAKILYLILKDLYIESGYSLLPDNKFVYFL